MKYPNKEQINSATMEQLKELFWSVPWPSTKEEAQLFDLIYKRYGELSRKRVTKNAT